MDSTPHAPSVVTLGNYDGVHRGHRALVARAQQHAAGNPALGTVALTFDPHPMHVLAPREAPPLLTTLTRRIALLKRAGIGEVVVQPFDVDFASWTPNAFVERLLVAQLAARVVIVGHNFRFGRKREGDAEVLRRLGAQHGFVVDVVNAVVQDEAVVSSSEIRRAVSAGDLDRATRLLGRVHDVDGTVVEGDKRGRHLGFPTANLAPDAVLLPPDGVYAVAVRVLDLPEGKPASSAPLVLQGVANLGVRPTFAAGRALEAHLLDTTLDLYGARLRVGFVARLRCEQRFANVDVLKTQIARDVEAARRSLSELNPEHLGWM